MEKSEFKIFFENEMKVENTTFGVKNLFSVLQSECGLFVIDYDYTGFKDPVWEKIDLDSAFELWWNNYQSGRRLRIMRDYIEVIPFPCGILGRENIVEDSKGAVAAPNE